MGAATLTNAQAPVQKRDRCVGDGRGEALPAMFLSIQAKWQEQEKRVLVLSPLQEGRGVLSKA